jgi:hypothetical protein
MVAGAIGVVAYNLELFGGVIHNAAGFAPASGRARRPRDRVAAVLGTPCSGGCECICYAASYYAE